MFRPNLFRSLIMVVLVTLTSVGRAQGPGLFQKPPGYWNAPGIHIPRSSYQAPIQDYYVGQKPQVWDSEQPIERYMTELAKRSWIRLDYLHWTLGRPGSMNIGANVTDFDPTADDQVQDRRDGTPTPAGVVEIPNMGNIALDDSSGIRGTWGLDLANTDLEVQFFGTHQNTDSLLYPELQTIARIQNADDPNNQGVDVLAGIAGSPNVVIPLMTDGAVTDANSANYLIFSGAPGSPENDFESHLTSQMWGAEAYLVTDPYVPGPGMTWQWLGGFRYMAYEEEWRNRGVDGLDVTTFGGDTVNNMYGPEVGFRLGATSKWFTFSATPRIAFTLNDYTARSSVFIPERTNVHQEISNSFSGSDIEFTPIVQVSFMGEVHLSPNFSLFGGYDFMWIYRMTRPYDNMVFDSTSVTTGGFAPNLYQEIDLESFYARGLSVGAVFRY